MGPLRDVQTIAITRSIRDLSRLRRLYGRGRWRKRKGLATVRLANGFVADAEVHWYEATGIGKRELRIKRLLSDMASRSRKKKRFVVCIRNTGYPASLELRKIYEALSDAEAEAQGLVRVVDESGEDYLYPAKFFVPVELPQALQNALKRAAG